MLDVRSQRSAGNDLDVDGTLAVLSSQRRRIVIEYLLERQDAIPVGELVDVVTTAESNGHSHSELHRDDVRMSLHHLHLPKLSRTGMIDHDTDRGRVAATESTFAIWPYVALARGGRSFAS